MSILEAIVGQARREAPLESCGYLAGTGMRVTRCYPVRNDDQAEDRFTFEPEAQLAAVADAEERGLSILALYHSHPRGPAWPSGEDVRLAFDPSLLHVVIGLDAGRAAVRAFCIRGGEIEERQIEVVDRAGEEPADESGEPC